ncbi:MAG: DUF433 domain-containing protein [bacterium]
MSYSEINIDPEIMSGSPVFKGTRVMIKTLFDYLEGGHTLEDFLEGFPSVSKQQALSILELVKSTFTSEKKLALIYEDSD